MRYLSYNLIRFGAVKSSSISSRSRIKSFACIFNFQRTIFCTFVKPCYCILGAFLVKFSLIVSIGSLPIFPIELSYCFFLVQICLNKLIYDLVHALTLFGTLDLKIGMLGSGKTTNKAYHFWFVLYIFLT